MISQLSDQISIIMEVSSKITLLGCFSCFQIFSFSVNSKKVLLNGPYASSIGLSIIKLLGTEFIYN